MLSLLCLSRDYMEHYYKVSDVFAHINLLFNFLLITIYSYQLFYIHTIFCLYTNMNYFILLA